MQNKKTKKTLIDVSKSSEKFAVVACYDFTTAKILSKTDVDMLLVGDSAAQHLLGYETTLEAKMDIMVELTAAVSRGAPDVVLCADMPYGSYTNPKDAIKNAVRFTVEASADIIKFETDDNNFDILQKVIDAGLPVMAHIGIRPQSGDLKAKGTIADQAIELVALAKKINSCPAQMLLLEGVATEVAKVITDMVDIPVIGCGSGAYCNGDVLIAPDIVGLLEGKKPKFAKIFSDASTTMLEGFNEYITQIKNKTFPDDDHSYHFKPGELEIFRQKIKDIRG